jgi:hypothetical protein
LPKAKDRASNHEYLATAKTCANNRDIAFQKKPLSPGSYGNRVARTF